MFREELTKQELQKIIIDVLFPYWNCIANNADYPEVILSKATEKITNQVWDKLTGKEQPNVKPRGD